MEEQTLMAARWPDKVDATIELTGTSAVEAAEFLGFQRSIDGERVFPAYFEAPAGQDPKPGSFNKIHWDASKDTLRLTGSWLNNTTAIGMTEEVRRFEVLSRNYTPGNPPSEPFWDAIYRQLSSRTVTTTGIFGRREPADFGNAANGINFDLIEIKRGAGDHYYYLCASAGSIIPKSAKRGDSLDY
jgi:hypothetical protein